MTDVNLRKISGKSSLLTRDAATSIVAKIREIAGDEPEGLVINFSGVKAITPSFLDQLIRGLRGVAADRMPPPSSIRMRAVPTRASAKFAAVARSHGLTLKERAGGEWELGGSSQAHRRASG